MTSPLVSNCKTNLLLAAMFNAHSIAKRSCDALNEIFSTSSLNDSLVLPDICKSFNILRSDRLSRVAVLLLLLIILYHIAYI